MTDRARPRAVLLPLAVVSILLLAVSVKVLYLATTGGFGAPPQLNAGDGPIYDQLATNMLSGQGYSLDGLPTATKPPGYPWFLAGVYALFGVNYIAVRAVQLTLLAMVAALVFYMGRRWFGSRAAVLGSTLVAMDPLMAYLSGSLLSESLAIFVVAVATCGLIFPTDRPTLVRAAVVGMLWGLAILIRTNVSLILPWLLLWVWMDIKGRRGLRVGAVLTISAMLTLVPWSVRNYSVFGTPIAISTVGGGTFWGANNPVADGRWVGADLQYLLPPHPALPEVELDRYYYSQAFAWIGEHPVDFLRLLPLKLVRLYDYDPHSVRTDEAASFRLIGLLSYGVFLPFMVVGFVVGLRNRRALPLYCLIGAFTTSALVFYGDPRMRSPIQPYLFLLAAVGLQRTWLWLIAAPRRVIRLGSDVRHLFAERGASITRTMAVVLTILLISAVGGYLFGGRGLGFRELVIGILVLVAGLLFLVPSDKYLRMGFYVWIGSFAVGWRQYWITPGLKIHPSEALIWLLFALLLARRMARRERISWPIPVPLTGFLLLGGTGVLVATSRNASWEIIVAEFKLFLILIPVLCVTNAMVRSFREWRRSMLIVGLTAFYVASMAMLEYYIPSAVAPLRGFFGDSPVLMSQQGFARADFTFFGGAVSSVYLSVVLLPLISSAIAGRQVGIRLLMLATTLVCGVGVYMSGTRGPWLAVPVALLAYALMNWKRAWLLIPVVGVIVWLPPESYRNIAALYDPNTFYDTSVLGRQEQLRAGLAMMQNSPFWGNGWGAAGWVHNDLVQIGANLGVPALLLFAWWYIGRMWRLAKVTRGPNSERLGMREYAVGLAAGLCAALINLTGEAIVVLPHIIIPLWFLLALADRLIAFNRLNELSQEQDRSSGGWSGS
ncbi:MAG: hypothetical protein EPO21_08510 [Chloroflexota bacterium]|nr:MAG: hypothetical protein EPO21_08510 [Chloroflexota bacterium]